MEKKKLLVLLLALLMIVGCSSADPKPAEDPKPTEPAPSTGNEDPAPSDEVTDMTAEITWWAFSTFATVDDTSGKYEESLVAKFNEKHPNIKVNVEMIGFQNGPERIITAIQGGTAPDVLFDAPGRIIDYGRAGDLVALDDMIEETGLKDDITPEYILQPSLDGTNYWMYPTSTAPFVMAVNKTSLEKESLFDKVPQEGARTLTTAEFEELSKEMQAKCYKGVEIYAGDQGGAAGIRAQSVNDINEIMSVVDLPVIGIIKRNYEDSEIYITATRKEVEELLTTNCQMIALDATLRKRPHDESLEDLVNRIHRHGRLAMADCSTIEEAHYAEKIGFDCVSCTLAGYTPYSVNIEGPNYSLIEQMVKECNLPVIAEGKINSPEELKKVMDLGVHSAVVGGAITRPQQITQRFVKVL